MMRDGVRATARPGRPLGAGLGRREFLLLGLGLTTACALPGGPEQSVAPPPAPDAKPPANPAPPAAPTVVSAPDSTRPNVLLITVDTWRADHVGSHGAAVQTPTADALARQGVRFANAYVQLPQTTPSHAALFSGQYPTTSGVRISQHEALAPGSLTLARTLAESGYRTAGLYSWYSLDGEVSGLDQGFETYRNLNVRAGTREVLQAGDAVAAWRRGENVPLSVDGRADVTTDAAIAWLDEIAGERARPYFLWVHYRDPHYPYMAPAPYDALYAAPCAGCVDGSFDTLQRAWEGWHPTPAERERVLAAYQSEITFADHEVGRLLAHLDALGLAANTLVVLTSDHGEAFDEHDEWFHGYKVQQTTTHVPLIARLPGVIPAGGVVQSAAQSIDLLPTILELVELPAAPGAEGRSLVPALLGQVDEAGLAISEVADRRYYAVVSGEWKLIRDRTRGRQSLFHLPTDPTEQEDRLAREPAHGARLGALLDEWLVTHR